MSKSTKTAVTYICDNCGFLLLLTDVVDWPASLKLPEDWCGINTKGGVYGNNYHYLCPQCATVIYTTYAAMLAKTDGE